MITIVGTGHIFDLSDRIHRLILIERPDLVAVEIDRKRHAVLEMERRNRVNGVIPPVNIGMIFKPSPIPFRFRILSYVQRKLAAMNNVFPGEEMLSAMDSGRTIGAKIALIDRDINKTLTSLNNAMKGKEKIKFYFSLIAGFTGIGVKKRTIGSMIEEMESDYDSIIDELGVQFPGMKRALIDERDLNMANALKELEKEYPRILAFVGDAHLEGMRKLLEGWKITPDVIHLHSFMKRSFFEDLAARRSLIEDSHTSGSFVNDSMQQRTDSVNIRVY